MRAVTIREFGGPEVLDLVEIDDPEPGPHEVVVDVVVTALNRADLLQRMGLYPGPDRNGPVPGMEFAGRVAAVGEWVTSAFVGDEVMGIVGGGAYAERLVTHERLLLPVPDGVALADAAAIPEVFITAWDALVLQGGLESGGVALVHAGGSGVGTAAIQLAKSIGAQVVTTASASKLDACRGLGADLAVDYQTDDFVEACADFTGGSGVDVVLDVVGGDYVARNVTACGRGATIVQVGVMGSGRADLPLGAMLPKRLTLVGTVLRSRPLEEKISVTQAFGRQIVPRFSDRTLAPVIDSRYPVDEVAAAHEHMAANLNVGKILLDLV